MPVKRQAELVEISRSNVYYLLAPTSEMDLALMRAIDELHLEFPFLGARQLSKILAREGHPHAGRLHVGTLMAKMGITAPYRKPNTSKRHPGHKFYPNLLRRLAIERADHVWAMDILEFNNSRRTHTALGDRTPNEAYFNQQPLKSAA